MTEKRKGGRPENPNKPKRHPCNVDGCDQFTYKEFCRKHANPNCQYEGCNRRTTKGFCRLHSEKTKEADIS